jgi:hypothetical protein
MNAPRTRVSWYRDSRTVILLEFPASYTWAEFWAAKAEADQMMDIVSHDCALIIFGPPNTRLPDNVLSQSRSLLTRRHPRSKLFLILTTNGMIRTVTRLLAQLFRSGLVQGIISLEEADRVLRAQGYLQDAPPPAAGPA